jgi:hypothetical protein
VFEFGGFLEGGPFFVLLGLKFGLCGGCIWGGCGDGFLFFVFVFSFCEGVWVFVVFAGGFVGFV